MVVAESRNERWAITVKGDLRCGNETDLGDSREVTDIPSVLMMQLTNELDVPVPLATTIAKHEIDDDNHAVM